MSSRTLQDACHGARTRGNVPRVAYTRHSRRDRALLWGDAMPSVLIADDEANLRRLVRARLTAADDRLLEAASPSAAGVVSLHQPPGRTGQGWSG